MWNSAPCFIHVMQHYRSYAPDDCAIGQTWPVPCAIGPCQLIVLPVGLCLYISRYPVCNQQMTRLISVCVDQSLIARILWHSVSYCLSLYDCIMILELCNATWWVRCDGSCLRVPMHETLWCFVHKIALKFSSFLPSMSCILWPNNAKLFISFFIEELNIWTNFNLLQ